MANIFYAIYRAAKRVPGVALAVNAGLRTARNIFWSHRPMAQTPDGQLPESYISFVASEIQGGDFTLIEVGAGEGRVLRHLARLFPSAKFIGIDIQKAAVLSGNAKIAEQGVANVRLLCKSCLDEDVDWNCDYLISRTALIYLNRQEVETFLGRRLPQVRRKFLLQEIVSLSETTGVSHFFANPISALAQRISGGKFTSRMELLDYAPWKRDGHWSGANIVLKRMD